MVERDTPAPCHHDYITHVVHIWCLTLLATLSLCSHSHSQYMWYHALFLHRIYSLGPLYTASVPLACCKALTASGLPDQPTTCTFGNFYDGAGPFQGPSALNKTSSSSSSKYQDKRRKTTSALNTCAEHLQGQGTSACIPLPSFIPSSFFWLKEINIQYFIDTGYHRAAFTGQFRAVWRFHWARASCTWPVSARARTAPFANPRCIFFYLSQFNQYINLNQRCRNEFTSFTAQDHHHCCFCWPSTPAPPKLACIHPLPLEHYPRQQQPLTYTSRASLCLSATLCRYHGPWPAMLHQDVPWLDNCFQEGVHEHVRCMYKTKSWQLYSLSRSSQTEGGWT